jgi:hypothetical protein
MYLFVHVMIVASVSLVWAATPYTGITTGPPPSNVTLIYPGDTIPGDEGISTGLSIETSGRRD